MSRKKLSPRAQADALADALSVRGFVTTVFKAGAHLLHPCIVVSYGPRQQAAEYIYAAPDGGPWRFWWSSLEPIAPISQIREAAEEITRVLAPGYAAVPDEAGTR